MRRDIFIIYLTVLLTLLSVKAAAFGPRAAMAPEQSKLEALESIISLSLWEEPSTRAGLWMRVPLDRLNSRQFEQLKLDFTALIRQLSDIRDQHVRSDERHQLLSTELEEDQRDSLLHLMPLLLVYRHDIRKLRLANPLILAMFKFLKQLELDRLLVLNSFDLSRIIYVLTIVEQNLLNHPYHLFIRDIGAKVDSDINEAILWIGSQMERQGDVIIPEVYYGSEE